MDICGNKDKNGDFITVENIVLQRKLIIQLVNSVILLEVRFEFKGRLSKDEPTYLMYNQMIKAEVISFTERG